MNKEKLTDFLSNLAYSFTLSFRASPKYFIGKCLLLIVNSVFPFLTALAWRNLLNDLTAHNSITSYVIMLVIVYVGLNIIEHFKGMLDSRIEMCYYDAIETYRDGIMISKLSTLILHFSIPHHFRTNYPSPCPDTGYFPRSSGGRSTSCHV